MYNIIYVTILYIYIYQSCFISQWFLEFSEKRILQQFLLYIIFIFILFYLFFYYNVRNQNEILISVLHWSKEYKKFGSSNEVKFYLNNALRQRINNYRSWASWSESSNPHIVINIDDLSRCRRCLQLKKVRPVFNSHF